MIPNNLTTQQVLILASLPSGILTTTAAQNGAVDKPYPIFKLRDKIEEKTGWDGYADTDRR